MSNNPGIAASVDYTDPLSLSLHDNEYILFSTDRFSRRTDMYAAIRAQFTATGTTDILVD